MKQVVFILFIALLSCSEDDEPQTDQGCLTGIPKSGGDRVLIRCSTHKQYLAGSNTSAGGTGSWELYTGHNWEKCDDCK